jgi:hypothetical protein
MELLFIKSSHYNTIEDEVYTEENYAVFLSDFSSLRRIHISLG